MRKILLGAFAGLLMLGCGSRTIESKGDKTTTSTKTASADAGTALRKAVVVSWSVEKREPIEAGDPVTTMVKIAQTIETGARDLTEVGVVEGTCKETRVDNSPGPKALLWLVCKSKDKSVQLKLVRHNFDLVVLKGQVLGGEIAYDVFKQIKLPMGARVTTAPMQE